MSEYTHSLLTPHMYTHTHTHTHSNHQVVEGADHQTVVQLIRNSGSQVHLMVVSVTADESRKLEPENTGMSAMDYFERRSVPVSIPDTEKMKDDAGKEYVVYNIYLANKHTASRRYREFDALNNNVSYDRTVKPGGFSIRLSCACSNTRFHTCICGVSVV